MSESESIRVNFGNPIPVFAMDTVVLLPQQVLPLHIFEPRYRQMIDHVLDGSGQIATALFRGADWKQHYHGNPAIRPAVCVGQIVQHESLPDGRYNLLLQGVCRARVIDEVPPDGERLYRSALLEPVGVDEEHAEGIEELRGWIEEELADGPLRQLTVAEQVLEYVRNDAVPTHALLELVSFALVSDTPTRYKLLSEPDLGARAALLRASLGDLDRLIRLAENQHPDDWPKGMSWN